MASPSRWILLISLVLIGGSACSSGDSSSNDGGNVDSGMTDDAGPTDAGNLIGCANPCTTAGATQCSGDEVETCTTGPGGCLAWSSPQFCSTSGQVCTGTACAASTAQTPWTVLIYVAADNTLEADAIYNMNELAMVGSNSNVNFVAEVDRGLKYTTDPMGNIAWTQPGAKRVLVENGSYDLITDLGPTDSGNTQTLSDFINWGVTSYPAQHYMLILWDHGGSWSGGFGIDETSGTGLSIANINSALSTGLSGTGVSKFDLFGFDACLMASVEVIDSLGSYTNYYLGSEEEEPGLGWDYKQFQSIHDTPSTSPVTLGKSLVDGFVAQNTDATATLALLDMSQYLVARDAVKSAASQISAALPGEADAIAKARSAVLEFGKSADPASSFNVVDFGDFLAQLAQQDATYSSAAANAAAELSASVIYKKGGAAEGNAHGLSIFFPPDLTTYMPYQPSYTALTDMNDWRTFIELYYNRAAAVPPPTFTANSTLSITTDASNNILASAPIDPTTSSSIATSTFVYGFSYPASSAGAGDDQIDFYGDAAATLSSTTASYTWNRSLLTLTSGATTAYGYLSVTAQGANNIASVPLAYLPVGAADCSAAGVLLAVRQLVLDGSGNVTQDTLYATDHGASSELTPVAGSHIEPVTLTYIGSAELTKTVTPVWNCTGTMFDATMTPTISVATPSLAGQSIRYAFEMQLLDGAGAGDVRSAFGSF